MTATLTASPAGPDPAPAGQRAPKVRTKASTSIFDPAIIRSASIGALKKLNPAAAVPLRKFVAG